MISTKNICLLLFATLISLFFISCSDDGPVQTEEDQLELDSELIGTWEGLGVLPRTLTFNKRNETEGFGIRITKDFNDYCENTGADYLNRIDFKWTQTKKNTDQWSSFFYDQKTNLDCGGTERNSRLAYEKYYNIEGDTLYLGTQNDDIYVRVE